MLPANVLLGVALGVVAGAFLPTIGRKLKAMWVKETSAGKKAVLADVAMLEAEAKKLESKL